MSRFRRGTLELSSRVLSKGIRRKARRANHGQASQPTRLGVEALEDRRMLAILIGPGDDLEQLNDQAPPAGQNLGSVPTVTLENFSLNAFEDNRDVFIYRAHETGKLLVSSVVDAGLDTFTLDVQDASGASLLGGPIGSGVDRTLPVVGAELYYIIAEIEPGVILGEGGEGGEGGVYTVEIENFAAPIPASVNLAPASDTGVSNSDGVTTDTTPTFFIQNDLATFLTPPPFGANTGAIDGAPGYDTELIATNLASGVETIVNATRLGASATWTATTPALPGGDYLVSARTRVDDAQTAGAGPNVGFSLRSTPIFITIDDAGGFVFATADLLTASDSGMFSDDNVTNVDQPAFAGEAPAGSTVRLYANGELVGSTIAGSDSSDGAAGDGQGVWEITSEPLVDGVYDISLQVESAAGVVSTIDVNLSGFGGNEQPLADLVIDTLAPNTPLLNLMSDSGRSNVDNITNTEQAFVSMTTSDPNAALAETLFADNLKFRIYDRYEFNAETLIYDSAVDPLVDPIATPGDMFTSATQLARVLNLAGDGTHNLKLEVEDRAGNISHDFLLEVIVDTTAPPVSFGLPDAESVVDGLAADSDSGVANDAETFADRITNDATPRLWGRAEADAIVQVYLDRNGDGQITLGVDTFVGQTVAVPLDGNAAFPDGYWELTSAIDLNQVAGLPLDGLRSLLVIAEDVAGNPGVVEGEAVAADQLDIFLDTQGPQVAEIRVNDLPVEEYDLFDPKPSVNGPTPLITQLVIDFADLPNRLAADFLADALEPNVAANAANYLLVGDHVGIVPIASAAITASSVADGTPATSTVTLTFAEPLPDDRFTLTFADDLVDPAGNRLDGESNSDEPQTPPVFPSGQGLAGGDFISRFTIDSRPELGSYVAQDITLDINGNFLWDPAPGQTSGDAVNVDLTFKMNVAEPLTGAIADGGYGVHDLVFTGQFGPIGQLIVGTDAVFIIDISGSTSASFGGDPVGDQNGDGLFNTILDAEIAAFKTLNQQLIDRGLGDVSNVSIVAFDSSSEILDLDPVADGVQVSATPLADADGDGMRDIEQALMQLRDGGSTNYEAGLQDAISVLGTVGTGPGDGNVIFLSDGEPNTPTSDFGVYADEVATIRDTLGMNLRAFGVGFGASLPALQAIDPDAETFSNTNELLAAFAGGGAGPAGAPTGFDQLAVYGFSQELASDRWLIDTNSDGVINTGEGDILTLQGPVDGFNVLGAIPIAGDFDGTPENGDEIGLYYSGSWALDTNRNFVIDPADTFVIGDLFGHPVVGDFDGNGEDDLAVFNNNTWNFDLAPAGFDGNADDSLVWGFPGVLDRPVAADMDQDGVDDIGLWVPRDSAQLPRAGAEWFFLISADPSGEGRVAGTINTLDHPYEPVPFGNDLYAEFGDERALPIVGNFDPPVTPETAPADPTPLAVVDTGDFNNDGRTSGSDFLAWQRGYGLAAPTDEVGLGDGDGNNDGVVDHNDGQLWEAGFGDVAVPAAASATSSGGDLLGLAGLTPLVEASATDEAFVEYGPVAPPAPAGSTLIELPTLDAALAELGDATAVAVADAEDAEDENGLDEDPLAI